MNSFFCHVRFLRLGFAYFLLRFAQRPIPSGAWQALCDAQFGFCKICSHPGENPKILRKIAKTFPNKSKTCRDSLYRTDTTTESV